MQTLGYFIGWMVLGHGLPCQMVWFPNTKYVILCKLAHDIDFLRNIQMGIGP